MRQLTLIEPHRLEWSDVDDPERQDARDALVRPLAVATCDLDAPIIAGRTPYEPPIAVGHECVAEVVEAPDGGPEPGTRVSVPFQISCGECERCRRGLTGNCESVPFLSMYGFGSFGGDWGGFLSDLVRVPFSDHMLSPLPHGVSAEAAASVSDNIVDGWRLVAPGLEQWPGGEVLVAGGSPSIGLYGVQVALALGAARVVYCDVEGERLRKAEELGAEVVDGYPARLKTSLPRLSASASGASAHASTRSVTRSGRSLPSAISSSTRGMAGRACGRPVRKVVIFEYISSSGIGVSGWNTMPAQVQTPSGAVERAASASAAGSAATIAVMGNGPSRSG